jgi:hypothetical protein
MSAPVYWFSDNGRHDYLLKRNGLANRDVHLVELDFLVGDVACP